MKVQGYNMKAKNGLCKYCFTEKNNKNKTMLNDIVFV